MADQVSISIGNLSSRIIGYLPDDVNNTLNDLLSYRIHGAEFHPLVKNKKWDGYIRLYKKNKGQSYYTGLTSLVEATLTDYKIPFVRADERIIPAKNIPELTFNPTQKYEERDYQGHAIDLAVKKTRGILKMATGSGKCLGKGTPVIMFDGSVKNVEDIKIGELLMGPDSKPRTVLSTTSGVGPLYRVDQNNGDSYVCNDEHILCVQKTSSPSKKQFGGEIVEITAENFYKSNKNFKHLHKGFKCGVEFPHQEVDLDPYYLGLWLGDGTSKNADITTGDKEIKDFIYDFAEKNGVFVREANGKGCKTYCIHSNKIGIIKKCNFTDCNQNAISRNLCDKHYRRLINHNKLEKIDRKNKIVEILKKLNVTLNKHIPLSYIRNSREIRLKLLAGLIDSDGASDKKGAIVFYNTNKKLAEDVLFLARSLGFRSSINIKKDQIKSIGYNGTSYRVRISGKISEIPMKLKRKCAGDKTKYSALRYGINLNPIGTGEYFGFEIDGDKRFLLGDFTVTHNTLTLVKLISKIKTGPFMFYVLNKDLLDQAHEALSQYLNVPIGKIGGGECSIHNINACTIQTAVRAVNSGNSQFDIKNYKYDDEDSWDEEDLGSDRLQNIYKLVNQTKGCYMDECHHSSAKSVMDVINASPHAYWKYAGSSTPYREDGADIVIQALFGRKIVDINASYLIKKGYLCKPSIIFEKFQQDCEFHSFPSIYKHCITENEEFNKHIADTAKYLMSNNLSTLILVQHKSQGELIKKYLKSDNIEFLTGNTPKKQRKESIEKLRKRETLCLIATTLADEGLDIPTLDAALLAGGGASSTRVNQRVGRTLRIDKSNPNHRTKSIVICYDHGVKYIKQHIAKVKKILKEEPEFMLINSKGPSFIFNDIAKCMDLNQPEQTLFDIMG